MLKNYLKITYRNFKRRKGHAIINVVGLSIALAACIFIGIYLQQELSYDGFIKDAERTYRIKQTSITPEKTEESATTPYGVAPALEAEYPSLVESTFRLYNTMSDQHTFIDRGNGSRSDIVSFLEPHFFFTDSTFFEATGVELIRGDPKTALKRPLSLVLTPQTAQKFFGDEDPMGKTITFETSSMEMEVTGIMEALPNNSHLEINALASMNSLDVYYTNAENVYENWFSNTFWTYVVLKEGVDSKQLSRQFPDFAKKYYAQSRDKNETFKMGMQPIQDIHLQSNLNYEIQPNSSIFYVYLFSSVAFLLLIIASINFMTLSTARASERSKEVGIRKALGAKRPQLFWQFMGESFLLTFIAVIVALLLVMLSLPYFNNFTGLSLAFTSFINGVILIGIGALLLVVGFLNGLYPALYLSSFEPKKILRTGKATSSSNTLLGKGLVTMQFVMSVILIIGTTIVYMQLNHMQQKQLGFDKQDIVIMPISQGLIAWEYPAFKQRVEQSSSIRSVTGLGKIMGSEEQDSWKIAPAGKGGTQGETNHTLWVTHDFIDTFGLNMISGRSFSKDFTGDNGRSILINREMVQKIGAESPDEALGALFYYTTKRGEKKQMRVVGVVENFNYTSIKNEIKPTVICLSDDQSTRLGAIHFAAAKTTPGQTQQALKDLEEVWEDINYIDPFNYSFQQEELEKIYAQEATISSVMALFIILCIIVACLGLFGLASYTAARRQKEIGIRKTLGASVTNIVTLLSKQYVKLLIVANLLAWPVIYYLAVWWLQDFPYRLSLGWNMVLIFASVAIVSVGISLLTVSYHSIKVALIDPVKSMKDE